MISEDKLPFREALLEHKTEQEWEQYRPQHRSFYHGSFSLEGREVTGSDLISEYVARFPADREYSDKGNLNRMLADCEVPQFSFTDPENIRGFLLSAKSEEEWQDTDIHPRDFERIPFAYAEIRLKGQMLLYNIFVELQNQKEGTHYAFLDYLKNRSLAKAKKLALTTNKHSIKRAFELAGLTARYDVISETEITSELVQQILLHQRSEDDWNRFSDSCELFRKLLFQYGTFKMFSGDLLVKSFAHTLGRTVTVEDLFKYAGISFASHPSLIKQQRKEHYDEFYDFFRDPVKIRNALLQVYSEKEWGRSKKIGDVREKRVTVGGRELTLHTLVQLYQVYKWNTEQEEIKGENPYLTLKDMQDDSERPIKLASNRETMNELLGIAGIEHTKTFLPAITDLDLSDPELLRRFLSHVRIGERGVSIEAIVEDAVNFRKARFRDPETEVEVSGQTLMLYYTGYQYTQKHPNVSLKEAVFDLKKGKTNRHVREEILERAGF